MKQVYEVSMLFDFYSPLLTASQQEILQLYYFEDLSLAEIAESRGVSRAAAHDLIRRSEVKLYDYEERLHLVERFRQRTECFNTITRLAQEADRQLDCGTDPVKVRLVLDQIIRLSARYENIN